MMNVLNRGLDKVEFEVSIWETAEGPRKRNHVLLLLKVLCQSKVIDQLPQMVCIYAHVNARRTLDEHHLADLRPASRSETNNSVVSVLKALSISLQAI